MREVNPAHFIIGQIDRPHLNPLPQERTLRFTFPGILKLSGQIPSRVSGTTYSVQVRAQGGNSQFSDWSLPITIMCT